MTVNPNKLGDALHRQQFRIDDLQLPTSAVVETYSSGNLTVRINSFDNGVAVFPAFAATGLTLAAGDSVLVIADETGSLWMIGG